jgi:hypothetical protein
MCRRDKELILDINVVVRLADQLDVLKQFKDTSALPGASDKRMYIHAF